MNIGDKVGKRANNLKYSPTTELLLSRCFLGIEIELEGLSERAMDTRLKMWSKKHDGSLRSGRNTSAAELVTPPLFGADVIAALHEIDSYGASFSPTLSSRTSVHVHLDVRNLNEKKLLSLVLLYLIYEQAYFHQAGYHRLHNNFCVPLSKSLEELERLMHIMSSDYGPEEFRMSVDMFHKYSALNLRSILQFGTLEFRHHPGEFRYKVLLDWVNSILALKRFAIKYRGDASELYSQITTDPHSFTQAVFGDSAVIKFITPEIIDEGILDAAFVHNFTPGPKLPKAVGKGESFYDKLYGKPTARAVPNLTVEEVREQARARRREIQTMNEIFARQGVSLGTTRGFSDWTVLGTPGNIDTLDNTGD